MSCPHSLIGSPDRCSSCLEAAGRLAVPVHRVDGSSGVLMIDGEPVRAFALDSEPHRPMPRQQRRRRT